MAQKLQKERKLKEIDRKKYDGLRKENERKKMFKQHRLTYWKTKIFLFDLTITIFGLVFSYIYS